MIRRARRDGREARGNEEREKREDREREPLFIQVLRVRERLGVLREERLGVLREERIEKGSFVANTCIMTDHAPMKLEKHYT